MLTTTIRGGNSPSVGTRSPKKEHLQYRVGIVVCHFKDRARTYCSMLLVRDLGPGCEHNAHLNSYYQLDIGILKVHYLSGSVLCAIIKHVKREYYARTQQPSHVLLRRVLCRVYR